MLLIKTRLDYQLDTVNASLAAYKIGTYDFLFQIVKAGNLSNIFYANFPIRLKQEKKTEMGSRKYFKVLSIFFMVIFPSDQNEKKTTKN